MKTSESFKTKLFGVALYIICAFVFVLIGSILQNNHESNVLSRSENSLLIMKGRQEKTLLELRDDLFLISKLDNIKNFKTRTTAAKLDLYELLKTKKAYDHVRIFDTTGTEIIRVNDGNPPVIVDSSDLQTKTHRSYFRQAQKLKEREYLATPLSLNVEKGKVEIPHKPVFRVITPIFNKGKKSGYLAINFNARKLINNITGSNTGNKRFDILDEQHTSLKLLASGIQSHQANFPDGKITSVTNNKSKKISHFSDDKYHFVAVQIDWEKEKTQNYSEFTPHRSSNNEFTLIHAVPLSSLSVVSTNFFWVLIIAFIAFSFIYFLIFRIMYLQRKRHLTTERKLHAIFNKSVAFIGLLLPDGTLIEANDTALYFSGLNREQVIGIKFWDAPWWSHSDRIKQQLKNAIKKASQGQSIRYDVDVVGVDGQILTIDFSLQPVKDENDQVIYIIPEGRDISEKIKLQKEIEANNQLYKAVQKLSITGVWTVDLKANRLVWDETVYAIHELDDSVVLNIEQGVQFYREDYQPIIQKAIDDAIQQNKSWDVEAILVTAKGNEVWVRALGYPVFEKGELTELRGTFTNIDTRKRNEQSIAEKEKRLRLALDAAKWGMWDWNLTNNDLIWDDALYKIYEVKKEDFSGAIDAWGKTVHPDDVEMANKNLEDAIKNKTELNMRFRIITSAGKIKHIKSNALVVYNKKGEPQRMIGVNKDISKRIKDEQKIKDLNANLEEKVLKRTAELNSVKVELEQQLKLLGVSAMVSETNLTGKIINANKSFCDLSGYSLEELIGNSHNLLKSGVQSNEIYEKLWLTISNGGTWQGELCNKNKSGQLYWVHATIQPFLDENGAIVRFVGVYFDITELKETTRKLSLMNKKLDFANKELETFSYSVSHDLKAPLRALQGFSNNIVDRYESALDETGVRWLNFIRDNASRMDNLISDILSYSRINKSEVQSNEFDMRAVIEDKLDTIRKAYKVPAKVTIDGVIPDIPSDKIMMEVVWQNLIDNAFKYSQKKSIAEIKIWAEQNDLGVIYYIADKGSGFDMRFYDKLFGVFQRLHSTEEFEGTGVGLANVQRIIEKHNGTIEAYGEVDKGATFKFLIPF